jgi:hypothetical protein
MSKRHGKCIKKLQSRSLEEHNLIRRLREAKYTDGDNTSMRSFDATQVCLRYRAAVNEYWVEDMTRLFTCVSGRSLRLQVITHATPKSSSSAAHKYCAEWTGKATTRRPSV